MFKDNMSQAELQQIENQLSCPNGDDGIEMAKAMNDSNIAMTLATIKALEIKDHDAVLEIGHGNCQHLPHILEQASSIRFTGLEIAPTMQQEALRMNQTYLNQAKPNSLEFLLYDGKKLPFADDFFARIMTVNTLYFWQDHTGFLAEIFRVTQSGGRLAIAFAQKRFMQNLPFVQDKFTLFDNAAIHQLVADSHFSLHDIIDVHDQVQNKQGDWVEREFSVAVLEKPI